MQVYISFWGALEAMAPWCHSGAIFFQMLGRAEPSGFVVDHGGVCVVVSGVVAITIIAAAVCADIFPPNQLRDHLSR